MDDALVVQVRLQGGCTVITAAGEIDIFTVARLREELFTLAGDGRPLIADLDRVTFLGAAGLGALASAARRAAARGASFPSE
jgi:anti-sigma B factor antagonist